MTSVKDCPNVSLYDASSPAKRCWVIVPHSPVLHSPIYSLHIALALVTMVLCPVLNVGNWF